MHPNKKPLIRVAIGIQARSTSERFPRKVFADICGKPLLQWVIEAAKESAGYLSKPNLSRALDVRTYLLIPEGDEIRERFSRMLPIIEGSEHDVLSRYTQLLEHTGADYVVRLTGDCPLVPAPVITKVINVAVMNGYDYVSNVDERLRLSFDGMDCEVMSKRLLKFIAENAETKAEKEHVTILARGPKLPKIFKTAHVVGYLDLSGVKLSVDTEEDLQAVIKQKERVLEAIKIAEELSGEKAHRF